MRRLGAWLLRLSAYRIAVAVGLLFVVIHLRTQTGARPEATPIIGRLENIFHDLKFHERGVRKPSGRVVVAAVDERAINVIGRWQWNRGDVGLLLEKMSALGARAVALDVAYVDNAAEGPGAVARKLRTRFKDVSLAGPSGETVVRGLEAARTDATGAAEAAKALKDGSTAARDVRARLEPVALALEQTVRKLADLQSAHREYLASLDREVVGKPPDEALGDSMEKSGRIVIGSFLLTPSEAAQLPAELLAGDRAALLDLALPPPTLAPQLGDDELLVREQGLDLARAPVHRFWAARAPIEPLRRKDSRGLPLLVGALNTVPDPDGVLRREPLVLAVGDPASPQDTLLFPNISLAGVMRYYDADGAQVRLWGGDNGLEEIGYVPDTAGRPVEPHPMRDFMRIPVDPRGRLLLNYYGPDGTFPTVSLGDVWRGTVPREQIDGRLVVLGATATGTFDQRVTPFSPLSPGVETHATALENILSGEYLLRPWWALAYESFILVAIALLAGLLFTKVSVVAGLPVMLLTMAGYHAFDYGLFRAGISVFSAMPLFEVLCIYVLQAVYRYSTEEREKRQIRRAFQFYLTKSVMEEMLKNPSMLKLGGKKEELSVMFSDIRGFTSISEKLPPEALSRLINEYLTPMTNIVFEYGGTLDKYIGDALMAIWGAPVNQSDHALRACRAAAKMMRELAVLQERWRVEGKGYPTIDIGIGVNSGPMVVGNMGADQRFDYTVMGDNVNLASRLEGTNKEYKSHVIISESTYVQARDDIATRELGAVRVKGKKEPVKIYELLTDSPAQGEMADVIERFNAGIAHFRAQRWDAARAKFREVLAIWPEDGPSKAYLGFCDDYEKAPPGADWDGVYQMTHK